MHDLDVAVVQLVNALVGRWPRLDELVVAVSTTHLAKGGVVVALLWWAWFARGERARETVVCALFAGFVAVAAARTLAHFLPFRERPISVAALHLRIPAGLPDEVVAHWGSAFPSDHAALFVALTAPAWAISAPAGWVALAYTGVAIVLPRLYLGLHYPSDLLAGALVGVLSWRASRAASVRHLVVAPLLLEEARHPARFYPALFIVTFEVAELFDGARQALHAALRLVHP